jgi:hypothetical protein
MINSGLKGIKTTGFQGMGKTGRDTYAANALNNLAGESNFIPVNSSKIDKFLNFLLALSSFSILLFSFFKFYTMKYKEKKMAGFGSDQDILLKEGKIRVSLTLDNDYEIFVNGGLARKIYVPGKPVPPTEEEIYQVLREVGIDPEIV